MEVKDLCHCLVRQLMCNARLFFTQIERIQNRSLWGGFQIKKKDMEVRNGHQNNERKLFHGACHTTIDKINELGFNRSYAGKNGKMYKMTNTRVIK